MCRVYCRQANTHNDLIVTLIEITMCKICLSVLLSFQLKNRLQIFIPVLKMLRRHHCLRMKTQYHSCVWFTLLWLFYSLLTVHFLRLKTIICWYSGDLDKCVRTLCVFLSRLQQITGSSHKWFLKMMISSKTTKNNANFVEKSKQ